MGKRLAVAVVLLAAFLYKSWDTFEPESVRGKRVLITGASSGIGEQIAYRYAQLGARLVLTARRLPLLQKVAAECKNQGALHVDVVAGDMAVDADRVMVIHKTAELMNGLDHLILNHAIYVYGWWEGSSANYSTLRKGLDTNFVSYVELASHALPLLEQSGGNIGVVSSGFAEIGVALGAPYSAYKHALHGFFESWRQELRLRGSPVSVTLCVLGPVNTPALMKVINTVAYDVKVPSSYFMATSESAADVIVRSVSNRVYKVRHNAVIAFLLALNDVFPVFGELVMNFFIFQLELI